MRQVTELTAFVERGGYDVVGFFKETASGASVNRTARNRLLNGNSLTSNLDVGDARRAKRVSDMRNRSLLNGVG